MSRKSRSKAKVSVSAQGDGEVQIVDTAYSNAENALFHEVVATGYRSLHGKKLSKAQVAATMKRAQGEFLASTKPGIRIKREQNNDLNADNDVFSIKNDLA